MTEPVQPVASRERVAEVLAKAFLSDDGEPGDWDVQENREAYLETARPYASALLAAGVFREPPTRDQILGAMIAAIYEDGDTAVVRQGMPSAEWNLLSIAADATAGLLP